MAAALNACVTGIEALESRTLLSVPALGINIRRLGLGAGDQLFADAMKSVGKWSTNLALPTANQPAPIDANGWPTSDAAVEVIQGTISDTADYGGTYALSFTGQATVSPVASQSFVHVGTLSYDMASNTTTGKVTVDPGSHDVMLAFTNTHRLPTDTTATGVYNIHLMRPVAVNSPTDYPPTTLFSTPIINLVSKFSAIRFMDYSLANYNPSVDWSDRTLPAAEQANNGKGGAWEYAVALGNATNEGIWINIPEMATSDYITKLAQLIKYGSDGINPYTGPAGSAISAANPNPVPAGGAVFQPLKANLPVYIEYSNEVWNTVFSQSQQNSAAAVAEVNAGGSPLNFDGDTNQTDWSLRRQAMRTVVTSQIFRGVFGDAAMMTQIRPLYEWQYGNLSNTASIGLNFLNNYYDNGDGISHVANPHPVNYYLWGGGGGWYGTLYGNSSGNPLGAGDVTIPGAGFSAPSVSGFKADPTGSTWTFSGSAGIAANGSTLGNPAATVGTQAAYIQGTGSFSESVNFTGGLADLVFSAASTGTETVKVLVDGKDISTSNPTGNPPWTFTSAYGALRTGVFDTGTKAGAHTVTFVGVAGSGNLFVSNVTAETANGIYKSTVQDITATTKNESAWAAAFGLKMAGYEGGFTFGGGTSVPANQAYTGTDLQIAANLDPRAKAIDFAQMEEFYAAGGDLAMYLDTTDFIAALTLDINIQNTSKIAAVDQALATPQPALSFGTVLPSTAGQSVTVGNFLGGGQGDPGLYPLNVTTPGTYHVTLTGLQNGAETEQFLLDGQTIPGLTILPTGISGNSSPALTFTIATPGQHALLLALKGSGAIAPSNPAGSITITAGAGPALPAIPPAPASPAAALAGTTQVNLSWTASAGASDYQIQRSTDGVNFKIIATTPNASSYNDTNVTAGATYTYRIIPYNAGGFGAGASAIVSDIVSAPASLTTLQTSNATTALGSPVIFTATVAPATSGATPTGTVVFYDGAIALGGPITLTGGIAMLSTTSLTAGPHSITATYFPAAVYSTSTSSSISQTVSQTGTATTTIVSTSSNPAGLGDVVTLTATITPDVTGFSPTGTVIFFDGPTQLGPAATVLGGMAAMTTPFSTVGTHVITADYSGDANDAASDSPSFSQDVVTPTLSGSLAGPLVSTVIATTPLKLKEKITLTAGNGPATGTGVATLLLSPDENAADSVLTLASAQAKFRLKNGRSRTFIPRLPRTIPSNITAGAYHVLIKTTDTAGNVFTVDSGQTINVVAPVVDLTGTLVVPTSVKAGHKTHFTLIITNSSPANVAAIGTLPYDLDTSSDGLLSDASPLVTGKRRIHLLPGKSLRITVVGTMNTSAFLVVRLDPGNAVFPNDVNPANNTFATSNAVAVS